MDLLQTRELSCPCCGELIEVIIDCNAGGQEYVEDCRICCSPMVLTVTMADNGTMTVTARPENT